MIRFTHIQEVFLLKFFEAEEIKLLHIKPKLAAGVKTTLHSYLVLRHRAGCCSRWRGWSPGHIWTSAAPRVSGPAPDGRTPSHWTSRSWPWRFPWKIWSAERKVYESESVDYCVYHSLMDLFPLYVRAPSLKKNKNTAMIHTPSVLWTSAVVYLDSITRPVAKNTHSSTKCGLIRHWK